MTNELQFRANMALDVAYELSHSPDPRHKQWVIDQMVRALCGTEEEYKVWTNYYAKCAGFEWSVGVDPRDS